MMSAVARTMAVLDLLGSRPQELTASEIVAELGLGFYWPPDLAAACSAGTKALAGGRRRR
jgi:hypothetical protein